MGEKIIQIPQGKLKGKIGVDAKGKNFYSFQGIPYAKPPVGELRFKAPVPADPWIGIFDATIEGNASLHQNPLTNGTDGSEDCLILNVYTPQLSNDSPLKPVMVWIHGGAFTSGSSADLYGPEFLIPENVIVITIHYRLGILGFLSLEDTSLEVPGNAGLKDMVLALKWIQNNVKYFNGDPTNVTIFGNSAGSAACHFLFLSQSAKGLFHRAILQSGVAINQWSWGTRNAVQIAQVLGSNALNEKDALNYLKKIPSDMFVEAQKLIKDHLNISETRPYGPIIEKPNPTAFITEHPMDIMLSGKNNKVPIIIGYTSREGIFFEMYEKTFGKGYVTYHTDDFQEYIPSYYNIQKGTELSKAIAKKIEDFYFGVLKIPEEDVDNYYKMTTDLYFARGIHSTIRALKTTNQPIYFYRFFIETDLNIFKKKINVFLSGPSHGDDIGYLFKGNLTPEIKPGSLEELSMQRMIKFWTNFAKTGNPNSPVKDSIIDIEWPTVTNNQYCCLDINKELTIHSNPEDDRMKFWDEISAMEDVNSNL